MPSPLDRAHKAWQFVLSQLRYTMRRADFDAWLRDAHPIAYDGQVLTIGVANTYARDWLTERLRTPLENQLRGLLNAPVQIVFRVASPAAPATPTDASGTTVPQDTPSTYDPPAPDTPSLDLQSWHLRLRDAIQQPHRVVFLPGYFLRWLPTVGTRAGWLYVALRQVYFLRGAGPRAAGKRIRAGASVEVTRAALTRWSHLTPRTINNILNQGLLDPLVHVERDRHLDAHRQAPNRYIFTADLPLTPQDCAAVYAFLEEHDLTSAPLAALAAALQQPAERFLAASPTRPLPPPCATDQPLSLRAVLTPILAQRLSREDLAKALGMAELLESALLEAAGKIFIPWYFIEHHLPRLGHTVAWLYLAARWHAEREGRPGPQGFRLLSTTTRAVAGWLGLKKARYGRDLIPVGEAEAPWEEDSAPQQAAAAFLRRSAGRGTRFTLAVQTLLPLAPQDAVTYRAALDTLAAVAQQEEAIHFPALAEAWKQGEQASVIQTLQALTPSRAWTPEAARRVVSLLGQLHTDLTRGNAPAREKTPKNSLGTPSERQKALPETPNISSGQAKTFPPQKQNLPSEEAKKFPHVKLNHVANTKEYLDTTTADGWSWETMPKAVPPKKVRERLIPSTWVAWLLTATAKAQRLQNPLGFAIHQVKQGKPPEQVYSQLAALGPTRLGELIQRHLAYGAASAIALEPLWQAMRESPREALWALSDWLNLKDVKY